ncbi:MAG: nitrile hydratase subunit beta [Alphaproteobacteria bacterium]|nr:nitrile hydratase subunit beta [Alphaproteobacteria bacterium]
MAQHRFQPGDPVTVVDAAPMGHVRTPTYCKGKSGVVERVCGRFPNPEELAMGRDGLPEKSMYRVRFLQTDIWPDYEGPAEDSIDIELYDHWLTPAEKGA